MDHSQVHIFDHKGLPIAYEKLAGAPPAFVWLGGFRSDMAGTKAEALADWARRRGQAFLRFDYSGHGRSGGRFEDGTITRWLDDALGVIDRIAEGRLALVGSSMGAWIALLAARKRPHRVQGLLLIAPAVDFTERLMWASFPEDVREQIMESGRWDRPSDYDPEPYPITRQLIEDGRKHLLMDAAIHFTGPVRILQGGRDPDVPQTHARAVAALIESSDLQFDLIADGDHRLSRPQDLERLIRTAEELAQRLAC